jgi:Tol biopolymer transport system component
MDDVSIALDWAAHDLQTREDATVLPQIGIRITPTWMAAVAVFSVAALVAAYLIGHSRGGSAETAATYVYDIDLPPGTIPWRGVALSPDARRLALVTQPAPMTASGLDPRLWVRDLASTGWQLVSGEGDEIPTYPFWSPDSRSLAFFLDHRLMRVDLPNLSPIPICDAADGRGGVWLADGTIVFAPTAQSPLMRVNASGGTPAVIVDRQPGETGLKFPSDAGGRRVLFWAQHQNPQRSEIRLLNLNDSRHSVPIARSAATGVSDGHFLYYFSSGLLVRQGFDVRAGRLAPDVSRVDAEDLNPPNVGALNVSAAAGHVAIVNTRQARQQLQWVDRTGKRIADLGAPDTYGALDLSTDGRRVAVERSAPGELDTSVWLIDVDSGASRRAVPDDASNPLWAPDNRHLVFRSRRGMSGNGNLYQIDVDGPPTVNPVVEMNASLWPGGWLADAKGLAFFADSASGPGRIQIKHADGTVSTYRDADNPGICPSPDGRFIAYQSLATGQREVVIDTFPDPGSRPIQVSRGGGGRLRWRGDGRELFFVGKDGRLMGVSVSRDLPPAAGAVAPLFMLPSTGSSYAVNPNGQRFLVQVPRTPRSSAVRLMLNVRTP